MLGCDLRGRSGIPFFGRFCFFLSSGRFGPCTFCYCVVNVDPHVTVRFKGSCRDPFFERFWFFFELGAFWGVRRAGAHASLFLIAL